MEADRVGIGYLAGAGFDANAMGDFFETMSRHEGLAATYIPAMLIDHPVTSDRIAEARARAAQFPPRTEHDSQSYELIRERVRVLTHHGRRGSRGPVRAQDRERRRGPRRPLRLGLTLMQTQPRRGGGEDPQPAGAAA